MEHRATEPSKRVSYRRDSICGIDEAGITYFDDAGALHRIDFAQCRQAWVRYVNASKEFPATDLTIADTRCVAWRDLTGRPPYMEFFTVPRTRFEFVPRTGLRTWIPGWKFRLIAREFMAFHQAVERQGWTTYDLS